MMTKKRRAAIHQLHIMAHETHGNIAYLALDYAIDLCAKNPDTLYRKLSQKGFIWDSARGIWRERRK